MVKKYFLLIILLFFVNSYPQGLEYNSTIKKNIETLINKNNFFKSAHVSIDIYDLTDDKTVYQKDNELLFLPASTLKLITSSAALLFLGKDYSFNTTLMIDGIISDSILNGSVIIKAGLDPLFDMNDLHLFSNRLSDLGIKKINGNLIADCSIKDSVYWGSGWQWDDEPSSDTPHLSALNINSNTVSVEAKLCKNKISYTLHPQTDFVSVKTLRNQNEPDISINRNWLTNKNEIIISFNDNISGSFLIEESKRLNLINPELYFLNLLKESLIQNGIIFNGAIKTSYVSLEGDSLLCVTRGIGEVVEYLLKHSDNLSAEMLLYAIASQLHTPANIHDGLVKVDSLITLIGYNADDYKIVDGSGLSRYNLISAELLIGLLKFLYKNQPEIFNAIYNAVPIAGTDGTLKNRMQKTSTENNVHAKTGTIAGVSALTGFCKNSLEHLIAFSINIQNYVGSSSTARSYIDAICEILTSTK